MTTPSDDEFHDLIAAHQGSVRRYAARRVPLSDVDEVVAEVFVVAWRHRDRLPEQVGLWLLRAARNTVAHHYRAQQRRRRLADRLHTYADRAQYAPDPADAWAGTEATDAVTAALARLPPGDQEVLRLTYWEQLDTTDIAYVLECSPAAARVRVHRARRRLLAALPLWLRADIADPATPAASDNTTATRHPRHDHPRPTSKVTL